MAKKNIFEARNPFSNLNNENTKNFVKQFEEEEQIKYEIMKIKGSKITSITKEIISKIDFEDREFINREISFKKNLEKENIHNLADSINDIGLINPVYVIENKNKKYKILSGFRRLSAIFYGYEKIEEFKAKGAPIEDGAFGENLIVSGYDLKALPVGTRLRSGEVLLEVTQIGKKCHSGCEIYKIMGDCIMPREGIFTRVLHGGVLTEGDEIVIEKAAGEADGE